MYEAAGEPKELYVVDGAAHGEARIVGGEAYERRVLEFLDRYLEPASAPTAARAGQAADYNPAHPGRADLPDRPGSREGPWRSRSWSLTTTSTSSAS